VSLCLGGKYFLVPVCPGWAVIKKYLSVFYFLDRHVLTDPDQDLVKLIFEFGKGFSSNSSLSSAKAFPLWLTRLFSSLVNSAKVLFNGG